VIKQLDVGLGLNTAPLEVGLSKAGGMFTAWATAQQAKLRAVTKEVEAAGGFMRGMQGFDSIGKMTVNAELSKLPYVLKGVQSAAVGLSAVLGGVFGLALNEAIKYETAMQKVRSLTVSSAEDLHLYEAGLKDIALATATGPDELAKSLYFVASAGLTGAKGLEVVKMSAMGAAMGMGGADQIGRLLSATINAFPGSGMTAAKSFDLLAATIRYGAAGANEYAGVMGNVLAVAEASGQSLEQVYSAIATYTRTGQTAGQAVTSLNQILVGIQAPSKIAADAFKLLAERGYDIKKTLQEKGLQAALIQMHEAVGKNAQAYRVLFPSIDAMKMAMALGGTQAGAYSEALDGISKSAGQGSKAFAEYQKTTGYQMAQMRTEIKVMLEGIGKDALPLFRSLLPTVQSLAKEILGVVGAFAKLPQPVQMVLLGTIATVGPLSKLIGMFGNLGPAAGMAGAGLLKLAPAAKGAVESLALMGTNVARAVQGLPPLLFLTNSAFATTAGAAKMFALALGTAALAVGTFLLAYKGMSMLMETSWGKTAAQFIADYATGQKFVNDQTAKGIDVTKTWSKEQLAAYNAQIAKQKESIALWQKANDLKARPLMLLPGATWSTPGASMEPGAGVRRPTTWGEGLPEFAKPKPSPLTSLLGNLGNVGMRPAPGVGGVGGGEAGVGGPGEPGALAAPIALSRDMVKEWRKETAAAKKTAEEWKKSLDDIAGVTAAREMDALRQQVEALGGAANVKNVGDLADKVNKLAKEGATIPKELVPIVKADQAKKALDEATKAAAGFKTMLDEALADLPGTTKVEPVLSDFERMNAAIDTLGPSVGDASKDFDALTAAIMVTGGLMGLTDEAITSTISRLEALAAAGKATAAQLKVLNDLKAQAAPRIGTSLGPATSQVTQQFGSLMSDVGTASGGKGALGLTNAELSKAVDKYKELAETGKLTDDQIVAGNALIREYIDRNIEGLNFTTDSTMRWADALQGVALLAGQLGGKFGESLQVVENLGQSIAGLEIGKAGGKWAGMSKKQKQAAGLGIAGQGLSMVGGLMQNEQGTNVTAGALQGAGSGAAAGAMFGPIGAGVGAVIGGVMGFLGAKKRKKEEERKKAEADKKAIADMTKALEQQYGSLIKARNEARNYGIDLKTALDSKNPKALEDALADLEKRTKGMTTAMEGAAKLAAVSFSTPEAAIAQGSLFGSVFWSAVKTQGLTEAAKALGDPFDAMFDKAGPEVQKLLGPIRQQIDLARNESFAAAADSANALSQIVGGLADAGVVSVNDLKNASTLASASFQQAMDAATAQGLDPAAAQEAAIRAVGPAIGEIIAQYQALGIPLDENLQKLKDTAAASGMLFPEDPMVKAADAMERVAGALEKAFGLSTGLADNLDRGAVAGTQIANTTGGYTGQGTYTGGGTVPYRRGTEGIVVARRPTRARVHEGEGVMVVPAADVGTATVPSFDSYAAALSVVPRDMAISVAAGEGLFVATRQEMESSAALLSQSMGLPKSMVDLAETGGFNPTRPGTEMLPIQSYAKGTAGGRGPVVVKRDMIARVHAGEGLLVAPRHEMPAGGLGYGSFSRGTPERANPEEPEERGPGVDLGAGAGGGSTAPSSSPAAPTQQELETSIESMVAKLLPQIQLAVKEAQPVTVNYTVAPSYQEDPLSAKERREDLRAFTNANLRQLLQQRDPAFMADLRRALDIESS
jgi:TP901 family phage tail tape measure protein